MVDPDAESAGLFRTDIDPDEDEPAEPRSGLPIKRIAIVSAAVAAAAFLLSAAFYGPTVARVVQQSDTTINPQDKVGTLTADTSDGAKSAAEYIRDAIATEVNLDKSVGIIYKDQAKSIILVAGTGTIWKPDQSLKAAFAAVSDDNGGVTNLHDVPSGDMGGLMRCGITPTPDGDLPVCGWADNGSVGVALFPGRSPEDAAKAMLDLRTAVEHRS
jgi:hypothetical protein